MAHALRTALLLTLAALSGGALTGGAAAQPAPAGDRPNVIVLFVDDLGYGDLGAYGSPDARTPHLDALAARGLRFTDFYAGGPVCTPSRFALLTGLHTFRSGDEALLGPLLASNVDSGLADSLTTMAEMLRDAGYETALIGKWHLGHGRMLRHGASDTPFHPLHHGFDAFFGPLSGNIDYNTHWHKDRFLDWWEDRRLVPEDTLRYATHVFGERAVAFLDAHPKAGTSEPPFFLYLPVTAPHAGNPPSGDPLVKTQLPIGEERKYLSRFDHLYPDDTNIRKRYLAMVAVLDDEVGRIVEALDRNGLTERTVFWFISDNGAGEGYGSNASLRGYKKSPYEGGVRVPAFVAWPGHIPPGVTAQLGTNVDVLPTTLALSGLAADHALDGLDLSAHLLGGSPLGRGVAVPNTRLGDAYRLGPWKLVRRYRNDEPLPPELYDLGSDPGETANLAAVYPDTVAALLARMPYGRPPGPDTTGNEPDEPVEGLPPTAALRVIPNPSRTGTVAAVEVSVPRRGAVRMEAFDALGRRLAVLHDGPMAAGVHRVALPPELPGVVVVRAAGPFGVLTAAATRLR